MEERKLKLGVGVLVIGSLGIGIGLTMFFGAFQTLLTKHYTITAKFPSAPGVSFDTPVRKNGVQIGRVKDIQLLSDAEGHVQLTMEIEQRYPIRAGEIPRIDTGSLITGDAIVEFIPGNAEQLTRLFDGKAATPEGVPIPPNRQLDPEELRLAQKPMLDGEYMDAGEVAGDPFKVVVNLEDDLRLTLAAIRQAGQSVDALAADVRQFVGGEQFPVRDIAMKTQEVLNEFNLTLQDIRQIVGNPETQRSLQDSVQRFPKVLEEAELAMKQAQRSLESFEKVGLAAEQTVNNVEQFTRPLGARSEELVDTLLTTLHNLDGALVQVSSFGEKLNAGDGTLRRLIEDEELYWQIRRVVDNAEEATVKIRPILDDVRIFTDKVSRDPRQLGIKGALDGRSTGLGIK